ncbi:hypothetical protein M4I21_17455 [Cellulophaga sp. 20_2_10]|nr:hypothetical protein [Cellulophaga sp. 20_2_10]
MAGSNANLYAYTFDSNLEVDVFGLDCSKAKKKNWQSYEKQIQDLYGGAASFNKRKYRAIVDGKRVNGIADNVTSINGKNVAVEAKYTKDWSKSLRNPNSKIGDKSFAVVEQQKMLSQAQKYSDAFHEVNYHTNSPELASHYTKVFQDAGLNNVNINVTP